MSISRMSLNQLIANNLLKRLSKKELLIKSTNNSLINQLKSCFATSSTSAPKTTTFASTSQPIGKRRFRLPVETDVHKIVNYCCGANYFKEGEDIKLKEDSEYPEWIWSLRLNYPPPIHELDPNTKEYYERLAIVGQQREWRLRSVWRQRFKIVSERMQKLEELKYRRRFRAVAKEEYDAGYEIMPHSEREDYWNLDKKEQYRLPDEKEPFYPGIDKIELSYKIENRLRWRKGRVKCGHFGQ